MKYAGDGAFGRTIPHGLGTEAGTIIIKDVNATNSWVVWHKDFDQANYHNAFLNSTAAASSLGMINRGDRGADLSKEFWLASNAEVNGNGSNYVAYVFAHDDSDESLIKCGSYTGNGNANGPEIDLGFEPQYVMIKCSSSPQPWMIFDTARGIVTGGTDRWVQAESSAAEQTGYPFIETTPTGFRLTHQGGYVNGADEYIYMAIKAAPLYRSGRLQARGRWRLYQGRNKLGLQSEGWRLHIRGLV